MFTLFVKSLVLHLSWWLQSLWPGKHAGAPLGLKRLLLLLIAYPLFVGFQVIHWFGFLIDECLFRSYRKVAIKAPVFISGIPRSGTTFVHRMLAQNSEEFTTVSTWEAVLAPSITERKVLRALGSIDRALGGFGRKSIGRLIASGAGDFNDIHEVGLDIPEEDYLWLLPAGSCFILLLAFPFAPWLKQIGMLNSTAEHTQEEQLEFYTRCIQKHLYCSARNKRFLSKNAAFASWTGTLRDKFSDAQFVLCIREPQSALSSQLSSLNSARALFATDPDGRTTQELLREVFASNYPYLNEQLASADPHQIAVLDQADLKADSAGMIKQTLKALQLPISDQLRMTLSALDGPHQSAHQHKPERGHRENSEIDVCLQRAYDAILQSRCRITRSPKS